MTHQELLDSGLLELYVADACTAEERFIVEEAMRTNPAVAEEVREISLAVEAFTKEHAVLPSADVRSRTLNLISDESTAAQPTAAVYSINTRNRYLIAASIGLLIGTLPSVYFLLERSQYIEDRNAALEALAVAKSENATVASKVNLYQKTLDAAVAKDVQRIALPSVKSNGEAYASVFWNTNSHEVVIDARGLPKLSSDQDYQLWAIVDGAPVDLGVVKIDAESGAIKAMKTIARPTLFAITVEPKGGRPTPTLEAMIVAGKVS